jgi:LytR cell envelope-related transcriptional attenuator
VEHSLPPLEASVRPWRTATIVVATIAALELAVIVVGGFALVGDSLSRHARAAVLARVPPDPANEAPRVTAALKPELPRAETSVVVLNGNGRTGAAAAAAERVRTRGYLVGGVGNAPRSDYGRTVVMYRRAYRAEAIRLARDLHVKAVGPLDGLRPRDLLGAHVALVIGS